MYYHRFLIDDDLTFGSDDISVTDMEDRYLIVCRRHLSALIMPHNLCRISYESAKSLGKVHSLFDNFETR